MISSSLERRFSLLGLKVPHDITLTQANRLYRICLIAEAMEGKCA